MPKHDKSFLDMETKKEQAIKLLEYYYLNDARTMCVAFSGGKDSTAVVYLVCAMLLNLRTKTHKIDKPIYIINSNTLAELPPLLDHLEGSLNSIRGYVFSHNLPIIVEEVFPEDKDTLNVQLLGVGMPPPSGTFRWCTDKLKVNPIDKRIKELFPSGEFISVIGTRKDESFSRSARIEKLSIKGTNLKINDRYSNASNLMPIEEWSTKNIWEYLLKQKNELVNIDFLWQLYSDASGKNASECSFVAAGGKHIDEGKIGCGVSRFGCWQCYMVRDVDKSLDGLMNSGYNNIELYKEYRDWFWNLSQQGWEKTRDVYGHRTQVRDLYDKGGKDNPKFGMTMPKGLTLKIRKQALKKLFELQDKLKENIINRKEIILIQERWILEGDLELTAFKIANNHYMKINSFSLKKELKTHKNEARKIYSSLKAYENITNEFSIATLKRFSIQYSLDKSKCSKKFFPTIFEEKHIKREWKKLKKLDQKNQHILDLYTIAEGYYEWKSN